MTYKEQLESVREQIQNLILSHPQSLVVEGDELAKILGVLEQAIRLENPVEKMCNHFGCTEEHLSKNIKIVGDKLHIFGGYNICTAEMAVDAVRGYLLSDNVSNWKGLLEPSDWMGHCLIEKDDDGWWTVVALDFYLSKLD